MLFRSNLAAEDGSRAETIISLLRTSVDRVSVVFGTDPPAAMFAWEVVRYFASGFDGIVRADDGDWLTIGSDYQPRPICVPELGCQPVEPDGSDSPLPRYLYQYRSPLGSTA